MSSSYRDALAIGPTDRLLPHPSFPVLERLLAAGRFVCAAGIGGLGVQCLILGKPVQGLEPLPAWLPLDWLWSFATGVLLVGSGVGLATSKFARPAAQILGSLLTSWLAALHAPRLISSPTSGGAWTVALETFALACAAWALVGSVGKPTLSPDAPPSMPTGWPAQACRVGFGASLVGFGVLHLIYWEYVSSVIPAWIPGRLFWTYATAAAFFAAGTALLLGIQARRAATWTGIMFLLWVLMLHIPRAAAKPGSPAEWTSLLIALAMGGGAWIIARAQARD